MSMYVGRIDRRGRIWIRGGRWPVRYLVLIVVVVCGIGAIATAIEREQDAAPAPPDPVVDTGLLGEWTGQFPHGQRQDTLVLTLSCRSECGDPPDIADLRGELTIGACRYTVDEPQWHEGQLVLLTQTMSGADCAPLIGIATRLAPDGRGLVLVVILTSAAPEVHLSRP